MTRHSRQSPGLSVYAAPLALAVVLAAGLLPAGAAVADSAQAPAASGELAARETGGESPGSPDFTPEQLAAFAGAVRAVQQVERDWFGRIHWAHTPEEAEARTARAAAEMAAAIEAQGLSVVEYNALTAAVAADRRLHGRVARLLGTEQGPAEAGVAAGAPSRPAAGRTGVAPGQVILTSGL